MEEYTKKSNTGDDVIIKIQPVRMPPPGTTPDDDRDHSIYPPTVILFGWLGAIHKNVSKYAALYQEMGYNTAQVIAPPSTVFALNPKSVGLFLLSILRIIAADDRLTKGGVVFMMFSNGGAATAPHLSNMFNGKCGDVVRADDELVVKVAKDSIAAVIFDSSPCFLHVEKGAAAINEGLKVSNTVLKTIVYIGFALLCLIQYVFVINLPRFFWTGVRKANYLCPELYLYSTTDNLLDAVRLEALIEERKQSGKEVRVFRVEDAKHCMLLREHPEKYTETIRAVNDWGVNEYRRRMGLPLWTLEATKD